MGLYSGLQVPEEGLRDRQPLRQGAPAAAQPQEEESEYRCEELIPSVIAQVLIGISALVLDEICMRYFILVGQVSIGISCLVLDEIFMRYFILVGFALIGFAPTQDVLNSAFFSSGTWCSGITSASHAEGPGFKSQWVQVFCKAVVGVLLDVDRFEVFATSGDRTRASCSDVRMHMAC